MRRPLGGPPPGRAGPRPACGGWLCPPGGGAAPRLPRRPAAPPPPRSAGPGTSGPSRLPPGRASRGLLGGGEPGLDPAPHGEVAFDGQPARLHHRHQVVKDHVRDVLVEDPAAAKGLEVELQALELHAEAIGDVVDAYGPEVRLAGLGADRGELRTRVLDRVVAAGVAIREGLESGHAQRHCTPSPWGVSSAAPREADSIRPGMICAICGAPDADDGLLCPACDRLSSYFT